MCQSARATQVRAEMVVVQVGAMMAAGARRGAAGEAAVGEELVVATARDR